VRRCWDDLDEAEQQTYINAVNALKSNVYTVSTARKLQSNWHDFFAVMHNENSCSWHESSFFLSVHRYFLWKVESALQWIARVEGSTWNPPITPEQSCGISIPYWDWEKYYNNMAKSTIFGSSSYCFGPSTPTKNYRLTKGGFSGWESPYMTYLMRSFDANYVGAATSTSTIIGWCERYSDFKDFSNNLYGAHGIPHVWISEQMDSMYSPSDPIFYLHHCNIDRIFALWQDCWDYEQYEESNFPTNLYYGYGPSCGYSYSTSTQMPYYYKNYDSDAFPQTGWPTPQQAYFMGQEGSPGYDGIYYRYGPDSIAETFKKGQWCSKNQKGWNLVNQTYTPIFGESKKRAATDSVFNETLQFLEDQLNAAQAAGLSGLDALDFIEMAECQNSPPLEITPVLEAWVKMNQGSLSSYDRICDNSSARFCATFPNSELCQEEEEEEEITTLTFESRTLEVIVIAEAVIIVILLIFGITSYCVKQQGVVRVDDVGYVQMGKV